MIVDDKVMRYVLFKKRTEKEVRKKCTILKYDEDYTDEVINYLKEAEYINDNVYIQKYINDVMKLKHLSIAQIRMDLMQRGVSPDLIDNFVYNENISQYEYESACYLASKKLKAGDDVEKIKRFLLNKGYSYDNVSKAIDNLENMEDN